MQVKILKRFLSPSILMLFWAILSAIFLSLTVPGQTFARQKKMYATIYSKKGVLYNIRRKAHLSNTVFETMQGGACDGTYAYYVFNRGVHSKSRIVKIRIDDIRKRPAKAYKKKSGPYRLGHGNDIAYNPQDRNLYVLHNVHQAGNPSYLISVFDSSTLRRKKKLRIKIPSSLKGSTKKRRRNIDGLAGITYNSKRRKFVILLSGESGDFLILDSKLKPLRYIAAKKITNYVNQGIDCTDKCIRVLRSKGKKGKYNNIIDVYKWTGGHKKRIQIRGLHFEGENIFHRGSRIYVSCTAYSKYFHPHRAAFICELGYKATVRKVRLNRKSVSLRPGQAVRLKARTYPRRAKNRRALYKSLNPKVATVSYLGLVRAVRPGKATIIAYSKDGFYTDACRVRVK